MDFPLKGRINVSATDPLTVWVGAMNGGSKKGNEGCLVASWTFSLEDTLNLCASSLAVNYCRVE